MTPNDVNQNDAVDTVASIGYPARMIDGFDWQGRLGTRSLLATLALFASTTATACHRDAGVSGASANVRVYVSNEDSNDVSVIDAATDTVVATIPVGKRPRGLRLSPDGFTLFVALSGSPKGGPGIDESKLPAADRSADGIGVIDLATQKLVRTLESGQDPEAFDVTSDGKQIVVSNEETAQASVVDVASGTVVATMPAGTEPEGVTMRPGGTEVYVASETGNIVSVFDVKSHAVIATLPETGRPRAIAFTPDGTRAFVSAETGGVVHVIDAVAHRPVGDVALDKAEGSPVVPRPMGVRTSLDGKTLYATNGRAGTVSFVSVDLLQVSRTIAGVGARPWGVDLTPDGRRLYVANGPSDDVAVIDAASGTVMKHVAVGKSPWGVVVSR